MNHTLTPSEVAAEAISFLGGPSKAARVLEVKDARHQTVQAWLRSRVPAEYCPRIEARTRERGRTYFCEWIRPDVEWGALRGHAYRVDGADAAPKGGD